MPRSTKHYVYAHRPDGMPVYACGIVTAKDATADPNSARCSRCCTSAAFRQGREIRAAAARIARPISSEALDALLFELFDDD